MTTTDPSTPSTAIERQASEAIAVEVRRVPLCDRLADLRADIERIADRDTPVEEVAEIMGRIQIVGEILDNLKAAQDAALFERLSDGRQMTIPTGEGAFKRYWVGPKSETKVRKDIGAGEAAKRLLETIGPEGLANCLSSNAIKNGATRDELAAAKVPEMYDELFEKVTKNDLITGEPLKAVQCLDERFVKPRGKKAIAE